MTSPRFVLEAHNYRHGLNFIKLDGDIGCLGRPPISIDSTPFPNRLILSQ